MQMWPSHTPALNNPLLSLCSLEAALPSLVTTLGKTVFSWVTQSPGGTQVMVNSQHDEISATFHPLKNSDQNGTEWDETFIGIDTLIYLLNIIKTEKKPFASCLMPLDYLTCTPADHTLPTAWCLSAVVLSFSPEQVRFSSANVLLVLETHLARSGLLAFA